MNEDNRPVADPEGQLTSIQFRRARDGDHSAVDWIIRRLTPALLAQANWRIKRITGKFDLTFAAEDVVNMTWFVGLTRLPTIVEKGGRYTPVFVRFLGETLRRTFHAALRDSGAIFAKHSIDDPTSPDTIVDPPDPSPHVLKQLIQEEKRSKLLEAIEQLPKIEQEILIRHFLEGTPIEVIAQKLEMRPNTVSKRLQRVKDRLVTKFPDSFLSDVD